MPSREDMVRTFAKTIKFAIDQTQPGVCCFGEFVTESGDQDALTVGYDGFFDLLKLADALLGKVPDDRE